MNIIFRHGPLDGRKTQLIFDLPLLIIRHSKIWHQYLETPRITKTGHKIFQYVGNLKIDKELTNTQVA